MGREICEKFVNDIIRKAKSKVYYFSDKKSGLYSYYGVQAKKLRYFVEDDEEIVKLCRKRYSTLEICVSKLLFHCAEKENYQPAIYIVARIFFNKPIYIDELKRLAENAR
ncbi:hypothetical protein AVT97_gp11 [Sulfolobales Virus YNP2]|uniref:hypothetical protein n=1 Tax=Sulfolobales Virus YNP2 TaxID=1732180 RepID=UPI000706AA83|nr:hypothetical protein AVT97_gp11 [Sulfolobales Virus YNP2]ALG97174.1 hypothetical protein [Sulfolobales Virus YNP2]